LNNTPYRSSVRISAIIGGSYIIARTVPRCASEIATEPVGCHQHDRESHAVTCSPLIGSRHDGAALSNNRRNVAKASRGSGSFQMGALQRRPNPQFSETARRRFACAPPFSSPPGVAGPAPRSVGSCLNRACAQPQLTVRDYRVDGENNNPVFQKQRPKPCRRPEFLRNKREPDERASQW
jgi:hypothetical protein